MPLALLVDFTTVVGSITTGTAPPLLGSWSDCRILRNATLSEHRL